MSSENTGSVNPITFPDVVDMIGHASYSDQAAEHTVNSADVKAGFWNCCEANPGTEAVGFTGDDGQTVWHRACKADASTVPANRRATIVTEADPDACTKHVGGFNIPGVAVCVGCEADGTHTMEGPVSPDAYAAWVAECAKNPNYEIVGGHPYGRKSGLPIFRNVADNSPGILARHRAAEAAKAEAEAAILAKVYADRIAHVKATETVGPEMPLATWEQEVSGVEILADMLTLPPVAEAVPFDVVKFHKLSAPMIGVLTEVARSRGLVGAWAMRNVVVPGVDRATMRTVTALIKRGILADDINEGNQSGTGGFHDYVLTETGRSVAEAIGCPVVDLPTVPEVIAAVVAAHDQADCETGCEVTIARGTALLPAGGDVCYGCGSIFTRPNGQLHPSLDVISEAVVARNQMKGN